MKINVVQSEAVKPGDAYLVPPQPTRDRFPSEIEYEQAMKAWKQGIVRITGLS